MGRYKYYLSKQVDFGDEDVDPDFVDHEELIIRVQKNGKCKNPSIIAPMCDFQEVSKQRIKCPKGYMVRQKMSDRLGYALYCFDMEGWYKSRIKRGRKKSKRGKRWVN